MSRHAGLVLSLALALCTGAHAADASRISRVTVYPGSATVERVLHLAPGARQAVFACLPAGLDAASLQASGGAGVRIGELAVRQQPRALLGEACRSHDILYSTRILKKTGMRLAGEG